MSDISLWITLAASLLSCYFAACSLAIKTFNRTRLAEPLESTGQGLGLPLFTDQADELLLATGMLRSGLNMVVTLSTLYWVNSHLPEANIFVQYILAFVIAGILVSIFGVGIAESLSRYHAEGILAGSGPLLAGALRTCHPLVVGLRALDPIVRRISGGEHAGANENAISKEVLSVVEEHEDEGSVDPAQKQMIEAVFELPTTTVGEIMTPRTEVQGLPLAATLDQVKAAIQSDGHSRIPVYEQTIDNVVGILFAKDLIRFLSTNDAFDIRRVLREALMVPESKPVRELLAEFKARKVHMAIVLDEYGGTAGVVTIEDIIEELVGEIRDEYEVTQDDEPKIRHIDARTLDVDARVRITDLAEELSLSLPDGQDYDTVGGFVFSTLGHIPITGEQFEYEWLRFTVTDAGRTRVNRVKVEQIEPGTEPPKMEGAGEAKVVRKGAG